MPDKRTTHLAGETRDPNPFAAQATGTLEGNLRAVLAALDSYDVTTALTGMSAWASGVDPSQIPPPVLDGVRTSVWAAREALLTGSLSDGRTRIEDGLRFLLSSKS